MPSNELTRAAGLIAPAEWQGMLRRVLAPAVKGTRRILLLPPDGTRANSNAGPITAFLYEWLQPGRRVDVMPALGTHMPMTAHELTAMFGSGIPAAAYRVHDWWRGLRLVGEVPAARLAEWSEGRLDYGVRIEVDSGLYDGYDLILSIGQVVPHEVAGMANYTKNLCVGAGGPDLINKSHFLGAVYGMERIMGRVDTPVRALYNWVVAQFMSDLPVSYILTVMGGGPPAGFGMRGLFVGRDEATFRAAADLSRQLNITRVEEPLRKAVVFLDGEEFKSTWLGNKAIYRTRMAMADGGELVILAPGLRQFGEDREVDRLIRKYGYRGTPVTLAAVGEHAELRENLSAAAHLIHGSSEGRFAVTYCPGPHLSPQAIVAAGYQVADLATALRRYDPARLADGWNTLAGGERIYFIRNPALGLWATAERMGTFAAERVLE